MKYMGIDLHKRYFVATTVDDAGRVLRKDRVSTDRAAIRGYFDRVNGDGDLKAVIEACYNWGYFYDEVHEKIQEVKVAHPLKTRAIAEARIKTDQLDSEILAHLLRGNLIAEAYAPDFDTRDKKNLLRYRASLVKIRTMIKNMVHAVLARNHIGNLGFRKLTDKFGKKGKTYMRSFQLRGNDTEIVNRYLDVIEAIEENIKRSEQEIKSLFEKDDICGFIESVPGIGELLAVLIRYEIDDIKRFVSASKLCSYAGLVPTTYSSGGKTFQGKITKQGNRWLRWALIEAAQRAIVKDDWLRGYYYRIANRGGTKRARVAVARKLLEIIFRLWKEKRPYSEKKLAVALSTL
ncbi:MAG: IS110 family transposase [Nitrospirota bacterium]|nr:IS110 family transposase [Nitrospirota bacterium]